MNAWQNGDTKLGVAAWRRPKVSVVLSWGITASVHLAPVGARWAIPGADGGDNRHHEVRGGRVNITSYE